MDRRKIDGAWVDEVLEILGMGQRQKAYPHELSGGQQQKIAVGRALINRPQLLLADEPTGNLDCAKRDELLELFCRLNGCEGMTIILVTHDPVVADMAGRRLCMLDGKLVSPGQNPFFKPRAGEGQRFQSMSEQRNENSVFLRGGENGAVIGREVAGR